mmetsp:Transcript_22857/g.51787  ORF Transcript_22857/g.51787 Transcript_22857/m.51787 type:complete len:244 (+) Transcript_22857:479-1210(+)
MLASGRRIATSSSTRSFASRTARGNSRCTSAEPPSAHSTPTHGQTARTCSREQWACAACLSLAVYRSHSTSCTGSSRSAAPRCDASFVLAGSSLLCTARARPSSMRAATSTQAAVSQLCHRPTRRSTMVWSCGPPCVGAPARSSRSTRSARRASRAVLTTEKASGGSAHGARAPPGRKRSIRPSRSRRMARLRWAWWAGTPLLSSVSVALTVQWRTAWPSKAAGERAVAISASRSGPAETSGR